MPAEPAQGEGGSAAQILLCGADAAGDRDVDTHPQFADGADAEDLTRGDVQRNPLRHDFPRW